MRPNENSDVKPFVGGVEQFRVLMDIQSDAERRYAGKLRLLEPEDPYVHDPNCCERAYNSIVKKCTPSCMKDLTFKQIRSGCGPGFVVVFSLFLVFIVPWLPMVFENHRSCLDLSPEEGIIKTQSSSGFEENDLKVDQFVIGFDKERVIRGKRTYDTFLYANNMKSILARYKGDRDALTFEELDPLCDLETADVNGTIRFCVTPKDNNIFGAPKNEEGSPILLDITSPQLPNFRIEMLVTLRKFKIVFPNMIFTYKEVDDFDNIDNNTRLQFTSSENSGLYVRRTFFEHGRLEIEENNKFRTVNSNLMWPGVTTQILGVGGYKRRFGIEDVPENVKSKGKFHRACVPTTKIPLALTFEDLADNPILLFEQILFSEDVSAKIAFHTRSTSLYRDFTGNNRAFKVSISVFIVMFVLNTALIVLDHIYS